MKNREKWSENRRKSGEESERGRLKMFGEEREEIRKEEDEQRREK